MITNTFICGEPLLALCWKPELPAGWVITQVQGDGNPEVRDGDVLWTGTMPQSTITMTYTVYVPLCERGLRSVAAVAGAYLSSEVNALQIDAIGSVSMTPYDSDGDKLPDSWEEHYSGNPTNMLPTADEDGDGMNNLGESIAGTDPRDSLSAVFITHAALIRDSNDPEHMGSNGDGAMEPQMDYDIRWPSVSGRLYQVEWTPELRTGTWQSLSGAVDLPATPPVNSHTDKTIPVRRRFYRVGVRLP